MHLFKENSPDDMAVALARIPVIDVGPWFAGEAGALARVGDAVRHACEDIGFFYISNHGVPEDLIAATFDQARRVHALPPEAKGALALDANNIGFLPLNASTQAHSTVHKATKPNQNESFFYTHDRPADHPDRAAGKPLRGGNQWPDEGPGGVPGFRDGAMAYFHALNGLGHRLLPAFAVSLGLDADYFRPFFDDENHATVRMLHYPPTRLEDNDFGAGPHTDNTFLTILARMEVPGLAVRLPGGSWITPPLIPGTFLVNIGNILKRMSNDRYHSTPHGVIVEGDVDRYSLAYFHSPNPDRMIEVVPTCTDADNPPRYEPALFADLVLEFFNANYHHQKDHGRIEMRNRY